MTNQSHYVTARVIAALLGYPDAALRTHLPQLKEALQTHALADTESVLSDASRLALAALMDDLCATDPLEAEARYVDTFDRGRRTSLHLFEHVHGDSRERGPALIDLQETYAQQGLLLAPGELPDYLPVVLEFAAMQTEDVARAFLGEIAHLMQAIHTALVRERSPYAAALAAALDLAGVPVLADERCVGAAEAERQQQHEREHGPVPELDEQWAEPAAFAGCSATGQGSAPRVQPIQFVPREAAPDRTRPIQGTPA
ncbi:nitrate reductase molybdenum cofactor assembly chaperone [Paraburkholderia sp. DHOC27]|uniref:nitrate reductase molybdenum cofactor assembly chaperone n=1 Tax=Paraburkholderia sp. DHOC27 TaxID=2303330 RepID=UPI000E3BAF93|nr:nitrate reductase molybdenum cofactor assembly chaperone [Paraburkholderia sp. DHOC27]RFU44092.1 nitrate reductase molybdenum cofactor assembly chaperone [Paraburkholderia sp. DHOC27]